MNQSALHVMQAVICITLLVVISDCQLQYTFYIEPSNSSYCSENPDTLQCYKLQTFITYGKYWWLSVPNTKITLLFLPGEHFLELDLNVKYTQVFWMVPYIQSNDSSSRISITCTNNGQAINFRNARFVKVDSISFHSCGVNDDSYGALQLRSVRYSEITNSKWYDSRSSAIFIQDSNTVISDCQFVRGNCSYCSGGGIYAETSNLTFTGSNFVADNSVWKEYDVGGLFLVESNVLVDGNLTAINNSNIIIKMSKFATSYGGGLNLKKCTFIVTSTSFLLFENNFAGNGGGLYFERVYALIAGTAVFVSNTAKHAGGGSYFYESKCNFTGHTVFHNNSCPPCFEISILRTCFGGGGLKSLGGHLAIEDANFVSNSASYGGAIESMYVNIVLGKAKFLNNTAYYIGGAIDMGNDNYTFTGNADFSNNTAVNGGAISFWFSECVFESAAIFFKNTAVESGGSLRIFRKSNITFLSVVNISTSTAGRAGGGIFARDEGLLQMSSEVFIENNHAYSYGGAIVLDYSVLRIEENSEITNNSAQYGGAIHAISGKLHFTSSHLIRNNSAQFGGGFSLSEGSLIYYNTETHIQFISNYALKYGGAIWVEDVPFYTCTNEDRICFYQSQNELAYGVPANLCVFNNNSAVLAGSNIYGGSVYHCFLDKNLEIFISEVQFEAAFSLINKSSGSVSPVSSNPMRICLCTQYNEPDCSISNHTIEVFSGLQFPLTLVGVGQMNGRAPAVVLSYTDPPSNKTIKTIGSNCTTLFYAINSDSPSVALMLYPESPCHKISTQILTVFAAIKPCPPGFMLHNETKSCACGDIMKKLDIQCDINSQSFSHKHGVWINLGFNETVIYSLNCPLDYCTNEWTNFTFNSTDSQCRYNRSGLICGACKRGYSITLGGSKCTQCSHMYLLLFLPLAVAGVAIVLFLLIFRLTVSMGTINGLIFFANIIGTNSNIFLSPKCSIILRVFIAWLNLDLGIETCLFDGLDMYIKVWLQFVFPLYVFMLTGVIIVVSQYSILFTKYLGSDPVAVLATLILLAYTKLFRAVLTVISFTYIRSLDGSRMTVWLYDGNVRYLVGKHIILFIFAMLILLLLIIPYTMILLLAPYLQSYTRNKFLFWIDDRRLKPFLYSYYAPLKDKYRSWIGLLLILRLCLLIVFVSNSLGDPSVNIFSITAVVIFFLCWRVFFGTFYTSWYLDALELYFLMKLGLFSLATLYVLNINGNQTVLADTIIGMTFILFIAILVYQIWRQITSSRWYRNAHKPKWQKYFCLRKKNPQQEDSELEPQAPLQVSTTFIELREPLLDC